MNENTSNQTEVVKYKLTKRGVVILTLLAIGCIFLFFQCTGGEETYEDWVSHQFIGESGSSFHLCNMIKRRLNDPDSFKHISTRYIAVEEYDDKEDVNNLLSRYGFSARVTDNDLYVETQYSANNAFGGRITKTAIGIIRYPSEDVTLLSMG